MLTLVIWHFELVNRLLFFVKFLFVDAFRLGHFHRCWITSRIPFVSVQEYFAVSGCLCFKTFPKIFASCELFNNSGYSCDCTNLNPTTLYVIDIMPNWPLQTFTIFSKRIKTIFPWRLRTLLLQRSMTLLLFQDAEDFRTSYDFALLTKLEAFDLVSFGCCAVLKTWDAFVIGWFGYCAVLTTVDVGLLNELGRSCVKNFRRVWCKDFRRSFLKNCGRYIFNDLGLSSFLGMPSIFVLHHAEDVKQFWFCAMQTTSDPPASTTSDVLASTTSEVLKVST